MIVTAWRSSSPWHDGDDLHETGVVDVQGDLMLPCPNTSLFRLTNSPLALVSTPC